VTEEDQVRIDTLLDDLPETYTEKDRELILRAYHFADLAHDGQKRASGEKYVTHCVAVAQILAEMSVPPSVVVAGLLHDTVEDTEITLDEIKEEFGDETCKLVDGVTKLIQLPRVSRSDSFFVDKDEPHSEGAPFDDGSSPGEGKRDRHKDLRNETLRKTFIAMGEDVRVVLIKLADRVHNMRTLGHVPEEKRGKIAQETLDIFSPLANRLGLWRIKWELEDISFRYVEPEKYKEIAENLSERRSVREREIQEIIDQLTALLKISGIESDISGRSKHIYSIFKKMEDKGGPFEMIRDLRGVRLIVPDIPTCYAVLGIIHTKWRPIPQEFDDYIAAPKDNFYQSIHTAVIYDDGKSLEVQIRTPEMHQNSEYGIAAHWRYKEKGKRDDVYQQRINWLRKLMEWRQEVEDAQEFMEGMKTDVFIDRVYIFTPQGDIIDLPGGSTSIDFAYHVHTEIGHRCRGAKVNGKLVTLDYPLKTGDQVQILTSKKGGPSRDWLNKSLGMVKTQRARSKIRQWFKRQNHEQNVTQGKMMVERELKRLGLTDDVLEDMPETFHYQSVDNLFAAIGCGDVPLGRIIHRLSELEEEDTLLVLQPPSETKDGKDSVTVMGMRGMQTTIGHCCNPAPGDEIIGYITRGRGVTTHRTDCPNVIRTKENERLIKVAWGEPKRTYPVSIEIKAYDRLGLMGDISNIINTEHINVVNMNLKINHNLAVVYLIMEVGDIPQLSRVLSRIENLPNVMEAHRVKPG
jgi:GTP pyrophosphokinase